MMSTTTSLKTSSWRPKSNISPPPLSAAPSHPPEVDFQVNFKVIHFEVDLSVGCQVKIDCRVGNEVNFKADLKIGVFNTTSPPPPILLLLAKSTCKSTSKSISQGIVCKVFVICRLWIVPSFLLSQIKFKIGSVIANNWLIIDEWLNIDYWPGHQPFSLLFRGLDNRLRESITSQSIDHQRPWSICISFAYGNRSGATFATAISKPT